MSKAFASDRRPRAEADLVRRSGPGSLRVHRPGRSEHGRDRQRRRSRSSTQATPAMAEQVIERVRQVTDKVRYVVLSHYHAVRAQRVGLPGGRDPRVRGHPGADRRAWQGGLGQRWTLSTPVPGRRDDPGLTWPTMTFPTKMTLRTPAGAGRADPPRARPYHRRHRRLGAGRQGHLLEAISSSTLGHCCCGDALWGTGRVRSRPTRAFAPGALVLVAAMPDLARAGAGRPRPPRAFPDHAVRLRRAERGARPAAQGRVRCLP